MAENFKKEDLAKTLLYTMCQELVRTAINAMHMTRTKHLFVAGSFISHSLTQRLVEEEFEYARWGGAMYYDGIVSKIKLKQFVISLSCFDNVFEVYICESDSKFVPCSFLKVYIIFCTFNRMVIIIYTYWILEVILEQ